MEIEIPYGLAENFHNGSGKGKLFFKELLRYANPKVATLAPMRWGFLVVTRVNAFGISSRLAAGFINDPNFNPEVVAESRPRWEKFKKLWKKLGGRIETLEKQIRKNYKKRPIERIREKIKKFRNKNFDGETYSYPTGAEEGGVLVSIISALTIVAQVQKIFKGVGNPFKKGTGPDNLSEEMGIDDAPVIDDKDAPEIKIDEEGNVKDTKTGKTIEGDKIFGLPKNGVYVGGILLTLGIVSLIWKPWKAKTSAAK